MTTIQLSSQINIFFGFYESSFWIFNIIFGSSQLAHPAYQERPTNNLQNRYSWIVYLNNHPSLTRSKFENKLKKFFPNIAFHIHEITF